MGWEKVGLPFQCWVQLTKPHPGQVRQAFLLPLAQPMHFPKNPKPAEKRNLCLLLQSRSTPVPAPLSPTTRDCLQLPAPQPHKSESDFTRPPFRTSSRGAICITLYVSPKTPGQDIWRQAQLKPTERRPPVKGWYPGTW